ncbi:Mitochondrial ubiquitin ligase activator of nfkb 1-A [Liparis tanakae]|uniref:RING-type E3 ubiquitin transferase n=1 Tax=Liparis tanakae TaxID=230148 RepID=A0A4Z2GJD8_9TELE|nr:Mitochondrial ubiquitin ligase activator of nfkb 1-A [Liparis tanakae]
MDLQDVSEHVGYFNGGNDGYKGPDMADFPISPLVLIGAGSSLAFSRLFYHLYQEKKTELKKLKASLVQADGEPLASQFVPRCFGVIQKITLEEQWKNWNSFTNTWNSQTKNRKESNNSVPFSLVSPGAYIDDFSVKIQNPLEASGSFLDRVHYKVRRAEDGLKNMLLQSLSGEKPVAMEESEEMLRLGSPLMGFGEVVLEGGQVMRLQPPRDGRKYILVPSDHGSFMDRHERSASMWKTLSAATGITGASLLAGAIYGLAGNRDDGSK